MYALLRNEDISNDHSNSFAVQTHASRDNNGKGSKPVQLCTRNCPFLGSTKYFFETVRRFFAADGEKDACSDDGGLRISVDVDALALASLTLLSLEGIFRICVFDNFIVNNCFAFVDFLVIFFCEVDDRGGQAEVLPLFFDDREALE